MPIVKVENQAVIAGPHEIALYDELKDLTTDLLAASGQMWNWPIVSSLTSSTLGRILYLADIYRQIIDIPGEIFEFGTHFGPGAATLINLRSLLEPRNQSRVIRIFDTFAGFVGTSPSDGGGSEEGDFSVPHGYQQVLERKLSILEELSRWAKPRPGFSLHGGDVRKTLRPYLDENPASVVSMAIFDMDIYAPTKFALECVLPFIARGGLLVFDEYAAAPYPGETLAVREVLATEGLHLRRHPLVPYCSWATVV